MEQRKRNIICCRKKPDGSRCDKFVEGTSNYCASHRLLAKGEYQKYKRACLIVNKSVPVSDNSQHLLKHYSLVEKAYNLRLKYRNCISEECRDEGHEYQLKTLKKELDNCELELSNSMNKKSLVDKSVESSSEEVVSDETPVAEIKPFVAVEPDPGKESLEYMDKLIAENTILADNNCMQLKVSARIVYRIFKITVPFDKWFETEGAFRLFAISCIILEHLLFAEYLSSLMSKCLQIIPISLALNCPAKNPTIRNDIAKVINLEGGETITGHMVKLQDKLQTIIKDLFEITAKHRERFVDIVLALSWDETEKKYHLVCK